jgi:hypothetical protein
MASVRFRFDAQLVSVRREVCPRARWDKAIQTWVMTGEEAQAFLAAGHARLAYCRTTAMIVIDDQRWLVGFAEGAPKRA